MFNRILIPLDGSLPATSALVAGEQLAERLNADLHILTLTRKGRSEIGLSRIIERQVARIEHKPRVDVRPLSYTVAEDIAGEFDRVDRTLVVMSTWARGRAAGIIGNVAEDVLRLVREPLIMLGPHVDVYREWLGGPLLIATDGSDFGDSIVTFAARLAAELGIGPRLATVLDPTKVPAGAGLSAQTDGIAALAASVANTTGIEVEYDVLHDQDPGHGIADHAKRRETSMIAMSTHGRSGAWRLTSGSVAMDVVRRAHCPVLLNRPPADGH